MFNFQKSNSINLHQKKYIHILNLNNKIVHYISKIIRNNNYYIRYNNNNQNKKFRKKWNNYKKNRQNSLSLLRTL